MQVISACGRMVCMFCGRVQWEQYVGTRVHQEHYGEPCAPRWAVAGWRCVFYDHFICPSCGGERQKTRKADHAHEIDHIALARRLLERETESEVPA